MLLRQVYDDALAQAAWLIGCQRSGEAIVIDPERDIDRYQAIAAREGLRIVAVAETHVHADFLSGAREFAERCDATIYLSAEGGTEWTPTWITEPRKAGGPVKHRLLRDGDTFSIGGIEFKALHTPGHTPEHLCYLVTDRGGGADQPMGMLSGDFLFVGNLGRPDLLESAVGREGAAVPSAQRLFASLRKLNDLPEWLQVWPAHGAGSACGKSLGAVPQSTLGYERRFNGAMQSGGSEEAFVASILDGQPEPPLFFARMKRDNIRGPRVLGALPKPQELTVDQLVAIDGATTAVIDTRAWDAFRAGHLRRALFHPLGKSFAVDVGSMMSDEEPVILIVERAGLDEAIRMLVRIGIDRIEGWFDAARWPEVVQSGHALALSREVPIAAAAERAGGGEAFLLDVRRPEEFASGHIEGATRVVHTRVLAHLQSLPKEREILVACRSGARSARVTALLERHGFRVTNLAGGMLAWPKPAPQATAVRR
ncbi:MAG: MBL fold metallo-hydrolase [Phycisphaeraceae bacterium]|nr:MBL fold metallo-hydrolase [Phycisphaeraceae bacterium]